MAVNPPSLKHLTDAELFGLALPATGKPEALPSHLSDCLTCSRAVQEWKSAARALAAEQDDVLSARSPQEWRAVEDRTLTSLREAAAVRQSLPRRRVLAVAASLLLVALAIPLARRMDPARTAPAPLSAQDEADDALLRDVARLSRGEESGGAWTALVPEGSGAATTIEEERS